jgi:hypothetical protein
MVNTTSGTVSDLVNATEIQNLPTDVRSASALLRTEPGVAPGAINTKESDKNEDIGGFVAGMRGFDMDFTIDGGNAVPPIWPQSNWTNVTNGGISMDALQEFRIYITNKPPDAGGKSGALEAITTRSGSNEFHGSLFEYLRNTIFDAANYFDVGKRKPYQQNQFGGSLGGPITRAKQMYFFGNYEGFRNNQPISQIVAVPTPALLAKIPGGAAHGYLQQIYADTFPAYIPGTSTNGLVGSGTGITNLGEVRDMGLGRLDIALPLKSQLTLRYMVVSGLEDYGAVGGDGVIGTDSDEAFGSNNALVRLTTVVSPNKVNEFRTDYDRSDIDFCADAPPAALIADGFNAQCATSTSLPSISVSGSGLASAGNPNWEPELRHENSFEYADTFSWTHGAHSITFGTDILRQQGNMLASNEINRTVTFDGFGSGLDAASCTLCLQYGLTTGNVQTQTQSIFSPGDNGIKGYRVTQPSLFVHDTYRVTRRLSLDLGLRWVYATPFTEAHGRLNNLYLANSTGQPIANAHVDSSNIADTVLAPVSGSLPFWKKQWFNFAPNIGVNWDPTGNGRMAISAGFSMAYERPFMQYMFGVGSNFPYVNVSQVNNVPFGFFATAGNSGSPTLSTYDPADQIPYAEQWNLRLQQSLSNNTEASIGYIGSRGLHNYRTGFVNGGASYTNYAIHPVRPNPLYSVIYEFDTDVISSYNGLIAELSHRFSSGLSYKFSYTFAHSLDDTSGDSGIGTGYTTNSNDPMLDYGDSDYDIRQVFSGNVVYRLPIGHDGLIAKCANSPACKAISGWQASSIFSANTGQPLTITSGTDNNEDGEVNDRAYLLPGASLSSLKNFTSTKKIQYLNPAANGTILSTTACSGCTELGRNDLTGPGFFDVDAEIRKETAVSEKLRVTFIAQTFNIANRINFGPPSSTLSSGTFGQLTALIPHGLGRVFQFALRFDF